MDKDKKEKLRKEKQDVFDVEITKLEKSIAYIQTRHDQKIHQLSEVLEVLKFHRDIFKEFKVK